MKPATFKDLEKLSKYIYEKHSAFYLNDPKFPIKYMDFGYDNRTKSIFNIRLRGYSFEKLFHVGDKLEGNLINEVYNWLKNYKQEEQK